MAIKGNELVEKRNILNEVRKNNMSLQELRFFSIYLSKINARDTSTRTVRFPLKDFQKIMEFGRLNTTQLKATTDSLLGKVVSIPTDRGGYKSFQLFKECTVDKDEFEQWYVEIDAHDKALPLMFQFKKEYFTYELWNALRLKSPNHLRMYELLKQYEKTGERKITLTDLRAMLGIGTEEYPRWDRFKDRIIDGSQEALAENTDICFDYKPIKAGRKIVGIHFFIKKNPRHVDRLSLDEFIDQQDDAEQANAEATRGSFYPGDLDGQMVIDDFTGNEEYDEMSDFDFEPPEQKTYQNPILAQYAMACDEEFSEADMDEISAIINEKIPAPFTQPLQKTIQERCNYIRQAYAKLKVRAQKENIRDRAAYIKGILRNMPAQDEE